MSSAVAPETPTAASGAGGMTPTASQMEEGRASTQMGGATGSAVSPSKDDNDSKASPNKSKDDNDGKSPGKDSKVTHSSKSSRELRSNTSSVGSEYRKMEEYEQNMNMFGPLTAQGYKVRMKRRLNSLPLFRQGQPTFAESVSGAIEDRKFALKVEKKRKEAMGIRKKKGQDDEDADDENNFEMKLAVAKALCLNHFMVSMAYGPFTYFFCGRVVRALEFIIAILAVFCEPQLGWSLGEMCPYEVAYDNAAELVPKGRAVPRGEPLLIPAYLFVLLIPIGATLKMWYKCVPFLRRRIANSPAVVRALLVFRNVLFVKRNPDSAAAGSGLDETSMLLITVQWIFWISIGLPYIFLVEVIILFRYFPARQIRFNFAAALHQYKAQMSLFVISPCYIFFSILFLTDGFGRETNWVTLLLFLSVVNVLYQGTLITLIGQKNALTPSAVFSLVGRMGRQSDEPPDSEDEADAKSDADTSGSDTASQAGSQGGSSSKRDGSSKKKKKDKKSNKSGKKSLKDTDRGEPDWLFPPFFITITEGAVLDLSWEKIVLNNHQMARLRDSFWNNRWVQEVYLPVSCFEDVLQAADMLWQAVENCVIINDCCQLERLNGYALDEALTSTKVEYTMDVYRFGSLMRNLPYEMFIFDAWRYLALGEVLRKPLTDFEVIVLTRAMSYNPNIQALDVSSNVIRDFGFLALAEFLCCNSTLKSLNIANNQLDALKDDTLDQLLDAIVDHPALESVQFSLNTLPLKFRDFEDTQVLRWDAYNVYSHNVTRIVKDVVNVVQVNTLTMRSFPPSTLPEHYVKIVEKIASNDLNVSRAIECSLIPPLRPFIYERAARHLGHMKVIDPLELLDLYVGGKAPAAGNRVDQQAAQQSQLLTAAQRAARAKLFIPTKDRINLSRLGPVEGMCTAMALRGVVNLREVYVEGNRIRDRGMEMFMRLLCEPGNVIEIMNLSDNEIGYNRNNYVKGRSIKWLERMLKSYKKNPRLSTLDLWGNDAFVAFEREVKVWQGDRPKETCAPLTINLRK